MAPTTTEEALEKELSLAKENLTNAQMRMKQLRSAVVIAEDQLIECHVHVDRIVEELRKFRSTYPSLCRRTKDDK